MSDVDVRVCTVCSQYFEKWQQWKHPGSAARRCRSCYNQYVARRMTPNGSIRAPRRPVQEPSPDYRPQGKRWQAIRAAVLADETHCGICGEPVDKALHRHNRMAANVDHIVPIAAGGDYWERSNLRLTHKGCNSSHGARQARERIAELEAEIQRLTALVIRLTSTDG